ncbi:sensor histidine kinase [Pleionea litopenaei]|uniref:histidine kinase n=1 Tax=Pleionea litopenaei TaxID=3070815 RepID=A0AA51RTM0_9GAMM|nr:ATP-binding protein [Pleionea sp. HL-JVS1]WMS87406.1 ATP-binding protein [Pleionea sp. HL-JVS1]
MSILEGFLRGDYMPHGHCYLWQPGILWTHVISDVLIAASYFSIPIALLLFIRKRQDIRFKSTFVLFSLFILFCGITHIFGIITIWKGVYGFHGIMKALTALVSVTTAIYLFKVIPIALKIPSPAQYVSVNEQLDVETQRRLALEHKSAEDAIFKYMADSIPVALAVLDERQKVRQVNSSFEQLFKRKSSELLNKRLENIIGVNLDALVQNGSRIDAEDYETGDSQVLHIRLQNGAYVKAEVSLVKKNFQNTPFTLVSFKDLSDIDFAEREIERTEQRFDRAISATSDGIWEYQIDDDVMWSSPILVKMFDQYLQTELKLSDWITPIHVDHRGMIRAAIEDAILKGKPLFIEYQGETESGTFEWFLLRGRIVESKNSGKRYLSGSIVNIQQRKSAEIELRENSYLLSESNKALERFAYVASHDLQEPLRKITAFSDRLLARLADSFDEESRFELSRIHSAAIRLRGMIKDLLSLAKVQQQKLKKSKVKLSQMVDTVREHLSLRIEETGADIQLMSDEILFVDVSLFTQVLQNLIQNSIRYAHPERTAVIKIDIDRIQSKDEQKGLLQQFKISVSDNGVGFEQDYCEMIFEPFKQLSGDKEKGSGIGLSLCKQIVRVHGGSINAISTLGEGSRFEIIINQR